MSWSCTPLGVSNPIRSKNFGSFIVALASLDLPFTCPRGASFDDADLRRVGDHDLRLLLEECQRAVDADRLALEMRARLHDPRGPESVLGLLVEDDREVLPTLAVGGGVEE